MFLYNEQNVVPSITQLQVTNRQIKIVICILYQVRNIPEVIRRFLQVLINLLQYYEGWLNQYSSTKEVPTTHLYIKPDMPGISAMNQMCITVEGCRLTDI